jgi:hypothetical protein
MFSSPLHRSALLVLIILVPGSGRLHSQVSGQSTPGHQAADSWASRLLRENFDEVQKVIKPRSGESRWMTIPWQTSLWEARQKAAADGKPMFVWNGSGGAPCVHT